MNNEQGNENGNMPVEPKIKKETNWAVVILGIVFVVVMGMIAASPSKNNKQPDKSVPPPLTMEQKVDLLMQFKADCDKVVPMIGKRVDTMENTQGKMNQDIRTLSAQQLIESRIMILALEDRFGKEKWDKAYTNAATLVQKEVMTQVAAIKAQQQPPAPPVPPKK